MELITTDEEPEEELTIMDEKTREEIETLHKRIDDLARHLDGSIRTLEERVEETENRRREVEGHVSDVIENHERRLRGLEDFEESYMDDRSGGSVERPHESQQEINRGSQLVIELRRETGNIRSVEEILEEGNRRRREQREGEIPEIPKLKPTRWFRTRKINLGSE